MIQQTESTIDIWFAKIGEASLPYEQQTKQCLSPSELSQLEARKHVDKRREFLLSRAMMRQALCHQFGFDAQHWQFEQNAGQAPQITNLPKPHYISLTHSHGLIAFALSDSAVGIDLERIKRRQNLAAIATKIMDEEDFAYVKPATAIDPLKFYQLWCCKEAFYKLLSPNLQSQTSTWKISILSSNDQLPAPYFWLNQFEDHMLSIASTVQSVQIKTHVFPQSSSDDLAGRILSRQNNYECFPPS